MINYDNKAAINVVQNPVQHDRTKLIDTLLKKS